MPPLASFASMSSSQQLNGSMAGGLGSSSSVSVLGGLELSDPSVPADFAPSLAPTADPGLFVDANGRRKRVWLVTVPPGCLAEDLEGCKVKKAKCTDSQGNRYRVSTRHKKDHIAVVVNRDLESRAVRMRLAGTVSLQQHVDIPGLQFDPPDDEDKLAIRTKGARQRFVPFGAGEPVVHSNLCAPLHKAKNKSKKSKKSKRSNRHQDDD